MDRRTDGQRENSIPPTNKVCGGYNKRMQAIRRLATDTFSVAYVCLNKVTFICVLGTLKGRYSMN